jgi:hypothetical protein
MTNLMDALPARSHILNAGIDSPAPAFLCEHRPTLLTSSTIDASTNEDPHEHKQVQEPTPWDFSPD